jgi:hypothetical protein
VPRPKHLPVEVWMPIASSKSIDYMASKDFKAMVTLNGEKILDDVIKAYRDACAKYGKQKQLGEDMIWGAGLYLADTPEEAKRRVEPSHDERYKWFAPFGFVRYADEQGRTWGSPGAPARTPSLADGIARRRGSAGPRARHRGHQVDRGQVSGARRLHDPLGGRAVAEGVQGAAPLVRAGRDAGLRRPLTRNAYTLPGYFAPGEGPLPLVFFLLRPSSMW